MSPVLSEGVISFLSVTLKAMQYLLGSWGRILRPKLYSDRTVGSQQTTGGRRRKNLRLSHKHYVLVTTQSASHILPPLILAGSPEKDTTNVISPMGKLGSKSSGLFPQSCARSGAELGLETGTLKLTVSLLHLTGTRVYPRLAQKPLP